MTTPGVGPVVAMPMSYAVSVDGAWRSIRSDRRIEANVIGWRTAYQKEELP
jgi:hypothetical protein